MTSAEIAAVFFDLGDTLGTPVLSPTPLRLIGFDVFPFVPSALAHLQQRGLRLGVISNTGNDSGETVNNILRAAGLLAFFDSRLLIYSKDVGLTKNSPEIFRLAAERAEANSKACLFVGEDAKERGFALDAGWAVVPHPLLVSEVLNAQPLQYIRITVPPKYAESDWRTVLRALPLVPLHVTASRGTTVYAVTSSQVVPKLMNMRFDVELLGDSDAPLRTELYILRDDAAVASGFLSTTGEAGRFFARREDARMVLGSTDEGLVVALPPERSLEEFHFEQARHGHTLKLLPDPSLLDPIQGDDASRASVSMRATAWGFTAPDLTAEELAELEQITGAVLQDRAERYGGRRPLSETGAEVITSRHIFHPGNERATMFVADEFQALGEKLTVRLHRFTHAGRHLHNVEVELQGLVPELVLLTAHLDSTAAFSAPYDADTVTLWCSNGSQSCSLQRVFACRRPENPAR